MCFGMEGPLPSHLPNPQDRAIRASLSCIYLLSAKKTTSWVGEEQVQEP